MPPGPAATSPPQIHWKKELTDGIDSAVGNLLYDRRSCPQCCSVLWSKFDKLGDIVDTFYEVCFERPGVNALEDRAHVGV